MSRYFIKSKDQSNDVNTQMGFITNGNILYRFTIHTYNNLFHLTTKDCRLERNELLYDAIQHTINDINHIKEITKEEFEKTFAYIYENIINFGGIKDE